MVYGCGGFRGSVDMRILWGFSQVFCGYGTAGIEIHSPRQPPTHQYNMTWKMEKLDSKCILAIKPNIQKSSDANVH